MPKATLAKFPVPKPDHSFARKPTSKWATFFWRRRIWIESTFAFTIMEDWEKVLLLAMFLVTFVLVISGLIKYFPRQLVVMQSRVIYYLWGHNGESLQQPDGKTISAE